MTSLGMNETSTGEEWAETLGNRSEGKQQESGTKYMGKAKKSEDANGYTRLQVKPPGKKLIQKGERKSF